VDVTSSSDLDIVAVADEVAVVDEKVIEKSLTAPTAECEAHRRGEV
jgi:hypothetical protein